MATIGSWGRHIKFQVSERKTLTFYNFKRDIPMRSSKHALIGAKPKLEITGPDLQTISFTMEINAMLGSKPRVIEDKLIKCMMNKEIAPLIIGKRKILSRAIILRLSDSYDIVFRKGEIFSMKIDVSMSEYN